jgi:hypothetical protein
MKQAAEHNRKLSNRLPRHKPDRDVWAGIEGALPGSAAGGLPGKLPVHRPDAGLWTKINQSLPRPWYATYRNYLRALAVVLLLLSGWFFNFALRPDQQEINSTKPSALELAFEKKELQQSVTGLTDGLPVQRKSKISPISNESENQTSAELQPEKTLSVVKIDQTSETENLQSGTSQLSNPTLKNSTFDKPTEKADQITLHVLPARQFDLSAENSNIKSPKIRKQNGFGFSNAPGKLLFEAGIYVQPTLIQNISTVNDDRNYSTAVGISVAMHIDNLILESGVSYRELAFDDKIAWDYYHFEFVGTLINTEHFVLENYISEQGDSLVRRVYQIELVDVYDSLYVEEENSDRIKLSAINLPLTLGYRLRDNGNFYFDLKTGLDMMIVTGKVVPGKPGSLDDIKYLETQNSLMEKYNVKWKYHLALGVGYRVGRSLALHAEPSLWGYPVGIRNNSDHSTKNPFEVALKLGLRWTF